MDAAGPGRGRMVKTPVMKLDVAVCEGETRAVVVPVSPKINPGDFVGIGLRRHPRVADFEATVINAPFVFFNKYPGSHRRRVNDAREFPQIEWRIIELVF